MIFFIKGASSLPSPQPGVATAAGLTPQPGSRLDIPDLATALQEYFQAGLAPSTQRTYGAGMKHFTKFCFTYSITDPFPFSELLLCYYTSYLARKGLAPQTIKAYLAALRNAQISLGLPDPREQSSLPLLKGVQAGIGRIRPQTGNTKAKIKLPITVHVLTKIKEAWQETTHEMETCCGQWHARHSSVSFG